MNTNYLDLNIATDDSSCPLNTKSCGEADTMGNVLCVNNNSDCPLTDVKVTSTVPSDRNYTVLTLGDVNFVLARDGKGKLPLQFKISDKQPCTSPYYENMNGKLYLLDAMKGRNTCYRGIANKKEDESYIKVDSYNKKNLFSDNNILGIVNTLPSFH
jgi:hypothetical protein